MMYVYYQVGILAGNSAKFARTPDSVLLSTIICH